MVVIKHFKSKMQSVVLFKKHLCLSEKIEEIYFLLTKEHPFYGKREVLWVMDFLTGHHSHRTITGQSQDNPSISQHFFQ